MDVVNAVSCVFLFMAAGPFLEKLFLTSASQNYSSATPQKRTRPKGSVLGPFSAGVNFTKAARETIGECPSSVCGVYSSQNIILAS